MKNVLISLLALAAISGAALASDRNYDLRDSDTYFGKYSTKHKAQSHATDSNAFAVANDGDGAALTAYERMMKTSEENENGRK